MTCKREAPSNHALAMTPLSGCAHSSFFSFFPSGTRLPVSLRAPKPSSSCFPSSSSSSSYGKLFALTVFPMEHLLEYSPTPVTFVITPGAQTRTHLTLRNVSDQPVAYKVKTTNVKRYCVRPNAAILQPAESIQVEIVQQAIRSQPPDLTDCRDRFQLQAVLLHHVPPGDEDVNKVWDRAPITLIRKAKFGVKMQLAEGYSWLVRGESGKLSDVITQIDEEIEVVPTPSLVVSDSDPVVTFVDTPKTSADSVMKSVSTIAPVTLHPAAPIKHENRSHSNVSHTASDAPVFALPTVQKPPLIEETIVEEKAPQRPPPPVPTPSAPLEQAQTAPPEPPVAPVAPAASVAPVAQSQAPAPPPVTISPPTTLPPVEATTSPGTTSPSAPISPPIPSTTTVKTAISPERDFASTRYQRTRALNVRPAPKVELPPPSSPARQRVAVERAGELVQQINARQAEIDAVQKELAEARHKLNDARMATRPAYDVRYEVNEGARVPFAQICIMAVISGALLQLLV